MSDTPEEIVSPKSKKAAPKPTVEKKYMVFSTANRMVPVKLPGGTVVFSPAQKMVLLEKDLPENLPVGIKKVEIVQVEVK